VAALAGLVLPQLLALLRAPLVAEAALPLVAELLTTGLPDGLAAPARPTSNGTHAAPAAAALLGAAPALLAAAGELLDEAGDAGPDAEAAALDALGRLASSRRGAALLMEDGRVRRVRGGGGRGRCWPPESGRGRPAAGSARCGAVADRQSGLGEAGPAGASR
jgi:hypothetical protein